MVCRDDGHRHCFGSADLNPLPYSSSLLLIDHVLHFEYDLGRSGHDDFDSSVHIISGDLERNDQRPSELALLGHHPDGVCNTH